MVHILEKGINLPMKCFNLVDQIFHIIEGSVGKIFFRGWGAVLCGKDKSLRKG
ncbi:hypothetical protein CIPAW_11G128500 [Carya illinoinensis]|uniref:Uncharacterized protein n=1 Tax=Carya illinoinensis TaxID=32201 RepID=A0A8T1P4C3_CARIL|nr:hypothetical protein CIPAW_11G128500 [Carya illinoinensis]